MAEKDYVSVTGLEDCFAFHELFSCAVCQEKFDNDEHKAKMLSCHHTFCCQCLEAISAHMSGTTLKCPTCKEISQIDLQGISGLRGNHYLNQFADLLKIVAVHVDKSIKTDGDALDSNAFCQQHENTKKLFWCKTCDQTICCHCHVFDHNVNQGHEIKDLRSAKTDIMNEILDHQGDLSLRIKKIESTKSFLKDTVCVAQFEATSGLDTFINGPNNQLHFEVKNLCDLTYKAIFNDDDDLRKLDLTQLNCRLNNLKTLAEEFGQRESVIDSLSEKMLQLTNTNIMIALIEPNLDLSKIHCLKCGLVNDHVIEMKADDEENEWKSNLVKLSCEGCQMDSCLFGSKGTKVKCDQNSYYSLMRFPEDSAGDSDD